jgi:hypothetical protein
MSYFNHSFHKVYLGTGLAAGTNLPTGVATGDIDPSGGYINVDGISTEALTSINTVASANHAVGPVGAGYFGLFNASTYLTIGVASITTCCPFIIASSPIFQNDKIGPFAGGYRESNKSKTIQPRYISQYYRVDPCTPQQSVVSIGNTPGTLAGEATACDALAADALNINNFQGGTTCTTCPFCFLCGETYYLRIDVKGSPALRFLNHQAYQTLGAYTGCCESATPANVDPTLVFLNWAKQIVDNPYMKDLIAPVVFDYTGVAWYAPGTLVSLDGTGTVVTEAEWWTATDGTDNYAASAQALAWADECTAGMRLYGAFEETKFGNCTFQVTDFYELEPVKINASLVDYTGDPCTFEGICVYTECFGMQAMGTGEKALRDLILSESYLQNYVGSGQDFRVREVTQGYDIIDSINRNALYGRYFIQHSVPRRNNPSGTFDNDQYMNEIIYTEATPATPIGLAEFEAAMVNILSGCTDCITDVTEYSCTPCDIIPDIPAT